MWSVGIKADGSVWNWGYGGDGSLGDNTQIDKSSPVLVVGNHSFVELNTNMGRKANGQVWCWGINDDGQIGDNTVDGKSSPVLVVGNHSFVSIIVAGQPLKGGLKVDGSLWTWGRNYYGEIGDNTVDNKSSPVLVVGNHSFIMAAVGATHMLALKADGSLWAWGENFDGRLGDNTVTDRSSPVLVVGGHSFIQISASLLASFALKADGSVWSFGANMQGQLGINVSDNRSSPTLVVGNHSFIRLCSGGESEHKLALKADGSIWSWGSNLNGRGDADGGQLGTNAAGNRSSPVLVVGNHSFIDVRGTYTNSYALKADGSIWAWGENVAGSIGDNTVTNRSSPVLVVGNHTFTSLSALPIRGADQLDPPIVWGNEIGGGGRRFVQTWRGNGIIEKMDNDEQLRLYPGKILESEIVEYAGSVQLAKDSPVPL